MADPSAPPAPRPSRFRGRLIGVAALAALVGGTGFALQHAAGPRGAPPGSAEPSRSGAWFCPHGGGDGWRGWVAITNPNAHPVQVRLTTFADHGGRAGSTFEVPGMRQVYRAVPADGPSAATEVEYFDGWVGAAAVLEPDSPGGRIAAERCVSGPHQTWFVADAETGRGTTSYLVVMNPFSQDAAFDVTLQTDKRSAIGPGPLTPYVVPRGRSAALRLNDFLLEGPDEHVLAVQVRVKIGRVVAGGLTISADGVRAEAAAPSPVARWVVPAGRDAGSSTLDIFNPTTRRADLSIVVQGDSRQRLVSGVEGLSIGPGEASSFDPGASAGLGVVVESTNQVPIVVARREVGEQGDPASMGGATGGAGRWLVMPGLPPSGGRGLLLLENPGRTAVHVSLGFIGRTGPPRVASVGSLTVPAGRMVVVDLSAATGAKPITVVVATRGGTIVAASASYSRGGGYGATLGEPMVSGR